MTMNLYSWKLESVNLLISTRSKKGSILVIVNFVRAVMLSKSYVHAKESDIAMKLVARKMKDFICQHALTELEKRLVKLRWIQRRTQLRMARLACKTLEIRASWILVFNAWAILLNSHPFSSKANMNSSLSFRNRVHQILLAQTDGWLWHMQNCWMRCGMITRGLLHHPYSNVSWASIILRLLAMGNRIHMSASILFLTCLARISIERVKSHT